MAALVQTLPPQTTVNMMPGRPSSSGGYHQSSQSSRNANMPRYNNNPTATVYRGTHHTGPVAPYAFTTTPQLAPNARPFQPSHSARSASTSVLPQSQPLGVTQPKAHPAKPNSVSGLPSLDSAVPLDFSKMPSLDLSLPTSTLSGTVSPGATTAKPSPDRYRRTVKRVDTNESAVHRATPPNPGNAAAGQLYSHPVQSNSSPSLNQYQTYRGSAFANAGQKTSADDMLLSRSQNSELAARYRRRSLGSIETAGLMHGGDVSDSSSPHPNAFLPGATTNQPSQPQAHRPASAHTHTASSESVSSSRSARSSRPSSATTQQPSVTSQPPTHIAKQDVRLLTPRTSEPPRRNPSPLSRPIEAENRKLQATRPVVLSPAAEQLAAVSQKDAKKSKSKLRRAFSFGSAAELRKATEKPAEPVNPGRSTKRNSKYEDELEPEQARIAEKQEAAGLGESIYSGQGRFFTGSTDNLSISSTASSASVMLRKMGKGVKKGTRSFVGLFRPKSVVGVPAADGPVNQASAAQVSMVTVEAEREKVNVNVDPHDQVGGGTGFPKLERNSIDAKLSMDSGTVSSDNRSRRSIVGGERERAEVLAAVKKGILKRTDSDKPSPRLNTSRGPDFSLPQIPNMNDSPRSSAPSTPNDDPPRSGHRRTDSIAIEGNDHDDYFASVTRYASMDSKSATPLAQAMRNISFSPRIQFHDTWPSGEYDRRGDIATCNRLTPMLAQQIKEELNTFKMEMEVHESSKVYTHFF
ncbi:uncharacterized protein HMPREF1541_00344 [Cyphellophora europaea CBS 101466]|uniref:Protein BNI4 n=1 Tax=Cyphellophora europaea (strain CBS 101466) TaxID=1220924 RepID=W2SC24_CYPE1|nr:uncharacterized protein HMPREF1541_00344 [Cyphellophora europaea CBS 101466]ETN46160.1 hypothetical protein HMPREF1541_00344 [Cyphellophora europaea CBS 101466]